MSSHHVTRPGPLNPDLDIDRALDDLRRAFPSICVWHGEYTGSLWALLPDRLVEARSAADLAALLRETDAPPRPRTTGVRRSRPSARRPDGSWTIPRTPTPHTTGHRTGGLLHRLLTSWTRLLPRLA